MPSGGGNTGRDERDDLSRYVAEYLERTGLSVRQVVIAARDPDTGTTVSREWLADLAGGRMERAPDVRRLRALAVAMGVDADFLAALAAGQWLPGSRGVEVEVAGETVWVSVPAGRDPQEWRQVVIAKLGGDG